MSLHATIIIEEKYGINRYHEPVTMGMPLPKGFLWDKSKLSITDSTDGPLPFQTQILATWPDRSLKWLLLDFQVSAKSNTTKELALTLSEPKNTHAVKGHISSEEGQNYFYINTKAASFYVNTSIFRLFERVVVGDSEVVDGTKSKTVLTDEAGTEYEPLIESIYFETEGPLRTTLKIEGAFRSRDSLNFAFFISRASFFANSTFAKIEFTILNPKASKHAGGLWDLGNPGSIFFQDLSIHTALKSIPEPPVISYQLNEDPVPMDYQKEIENQELRAKSYEVNGGSHLLIYQDSSGGENWQSRNHVNRNGEVKNSYRGYRVCSDGNTIKEGLRASPVISLRGIDNKYSVALQYFWQNFPKALEVKDKTLIVRLFPKYYNDVFELQGGEQKTHIIYLDSSSSRNGNIGLDWIQCPLVPRLTPEWYAHSKAFNYLVPESEDRNKELSRLANTAIYGNKTFFRRREIIDEYGWRNFGEFYADHEAVGHEGPDPLISHYNNQYDCIYGALMQFVRNGNHKWFLLADQLCRHVKDIDIYHTDEDRPEYNRGCFWHTEHYMDARTATHRCFSKKNAEHKNLGSYGGGPSLSHNYTTGLLYHYYMTGSQSSLCAVKELASFVEDNMKMELTVSSHILKGMRKVQRSIEKVRKKQGRVQIKKIYNLDGPGRASGNSLNTLIDAYIVTNKRECLVITEDLIRQCIHPEDNIEKRNLSDVENRWMYTIFLQFLGKYLDLKVEIDEFDRMYEYARLSLIHYAGWMLQNEHPYLEKPEKLEYPNETWPAQDIRKCNILLIASKYSDGGENQKFAQKAAFFFNEAMHQLLRFKTRDLTRPIALIMQNGMMYSYFKACGFKPLSRHNTMKLSSPCATVNLKFTTLPHAIYQIKKMLGSFSIRREFEFIKWRVASKL